MDVKTAAQIAGLVDPKTVGQAEHSITEEERSLAIEVGHEMAERDGIDLDALVREHEADQREASRSLGYTDAEIDRMWAGNRIV